MNIPDGCATREFLRKMKMRAKGMLTTGYYFAGRMRYFDCKKYDNDIDSLASDIVQDAWTSLLKHGEPDTPIRDWAALFRWQMKCEIQEIVRKNLNLPEMVGLHSPMDIPFSGEPLLQIDVIPAPQTEATFERWMRWNQRFWEAQQEDLDAVERHVELLVSLGAIQVPDQGAVFVQMVKRILADPSSSFYTHWKHVAAVCGDNAPSRATAARWWSDIQPLLPIPIEALRLLAEGDPE